MTRIGRHDGDFTTLLAEAVDLGLRDNDPAGIGAVFLSAFAPAELCGISDPAGLTRHILQARIPAFDAPVFGPFLTGAEATIRAIEYPAGDRDVLVIGCEKMTHADAGVAAGLLAPRVADPVEQRHGATLPALAALATAAYRDAYRVPAAAFDAVAVKNHAHGARNPLAHFQQTITRDDVQRSPMIADPLRRYHCAPISDGAAACVLSRTSGAVRIAGWARALDTPRFHERARLGEFRAAFHAAREAFAMAARSPADVHVVEIHDAFASFELMNLEAMGFFPHGEAWRALDRGALHVGGELAVNPSGGMKARGHPIGVCGLTSLVEVFEQLTGSAGGRQQPGAGVAAIQSAGGVSRECYAFVVEAVA
ncbi:MAG TPA: thiolase family protein [Candidatus Krumholzibacteria bacterium]|nr:thiolase family protein [Candidatus Krumholzibacteria bacterium]